MFLLSAQDEDHPTNQASFRVRDPSRATESSEKPMDFRKAVAGAEDLGQGVRGFLSTGKSWQAVDQVCVALRRRCGILLYPLTSSKEQTSVHSL